MAAALLLWPAMSLIGYIGAAAFAMAWIPQCLETWRARRCDVNGSFLVLNAIGSFSLALYALLRADVVFTAINALTTGGALLNLYIKTSGDRYKANGYSGRNVATPALTADGGERKTP